MNSIVSPGRAAAHPSANVPSGARLGCHAGSAVRLRFAFLSAMLMAFLAPELRAAQFTLSWADNSTNETGFRIERSANGATFTEIATVPANVVSYVDADLPSSATYSYRVCAYNEAGNSAYSNVATGTTPPPASNSAPTISDIANRSISAGSSTGGIVFTVGDVETAAASLSVTAGSSDAALVPASAIVLGGSGSSRTISVTPAAGRTGSATITVTVSDGSLTASDTFVLTVSAVNTAPTISDIANRTINEDGSTGSIGFTVGDNQTLAGNLVVTATSSNTALIPAAGLALGGSGASRTITVTPAANQSGSATITVTVSDGALTASDSFVVTVNAVNDAPTISNIPNRVIDQDTTTGSISFTVGDVETSAASLSVSASSSDSTIVSSASISFGGSGANRTLSVTPLGGRTGTATITVTVSDGSATASSSFVLTVNSTAVAPRITAQPVAASVVAGASAAFSVTATGTPAPSYQWRRDGEAIVGATSATYSIASAGVSHAGTYTVVVSNSAGTVTSSAAALTVAEKLAILSQPQDQTIARGATAILNVAASGSALAYQWFAGSSGDTAAPVPGATSATFTTPKLSENRSYWVRVSAGSQSVNSSAAMVTVMDRPRTGSGFIKKGDRALQAISTLGMGVVADGTFAVMIMEDGTLQMLGIDASSGLLIDAGGVALDATGAFSFVADGVGTVTGQVSGTMITGSIVGTELTFSGAIDPVDGSTGAMSGWYNGVVVNSSNDEVIVLAGAEGAAFVLAYIDGVPAGGLALLDTAGNIQVALANGATLNLALNAGTGRIAGTAVAADRTDRVSGARAGEAVDKRLVNTSVRAQVRQGDALMVAGFVIGGTGSKRVLIRAVGPTLGELGVTGQLADPMVTLFRHGTPSPIGQNDDWSSAVNASEIAAVAARVGAFALPVGSKDAAMVVDLPAGIYTAQVTGVRGLTGAALVEVYDADGVAGAAAIPTQLSNISMRGIAGPGNDLVIAGFVVSGNAPKQVLIRAVGPELAQFNVAGVAEDPVLTIYSRVATGNVQIAGNNDWGVDAAAVSAAGDRVGAFRLTSGSRSSAVVIWLEPGVYTAHASTNSGRSGVALVEVYEVQ